MIPASVDSSSFRWREPVAARRGGGSAQAEALWRKGVAALEQGQWIEARRCFDLAIRLDPDEGLFWLNLAQAHRKLGDLRDAEAAARRAYELDPESLLACKLVAMSLVEQRRHAEAVAVFASLPATVQRDHDFHCAYGESLYWLDRYADSCEQFILSFTCKPDHAPAHARLSASFKQLGMHEEAAECLRTVMLLQPWDAQGLGNLIFQKLQACRWDTLEQDTTELTRLITDDHPPHTNPFGYLMLDTTGPQQRRVAEISASFEFGGIEPLAADTRAPRPAGERLRIGYVSADFQHHATAMLMTEVLERHDRSRFEVFLYSCGSDDGSQFRRRVMQASEHWVDVAECSDHDLAKRIRADGIDIAIDLKGYTRNTRLHVFARRPAPIQVSWLGYPGTCATTFIDYIIGDPVVTPAHAQADFSECIAQMPVSYQPNDRQRPLGQSVPRAALGLPDDAFVFCCFNNNYKITPAIFERWCRLLQAVPGSVLWLFEANPQATSNLLREAAQLGIDASRLVFAPFVSQAKHIARLPAADLFLDTLPCNAHTTASDALWAGLPMITCEGETFAGRVASSLLRAVGCEELVTHSFDEYQALAEALARDPDRLRSIRERLAAQRMTSPLFDSERFARDLEALYVRMAERWRAGLAPAALLAEDARA